MATSKKTTTTKTTKKPTTKKTVAKKTPNSKVVRKKEEKKSLIWSILFTEIPVTYGIVSVLLILLIGFFIIIGLQQ